MSLLTIIQAAMLRQNQAAPSTVIGNTDTGVQQRVALLQDIGDELSERYTWQTLNTPAQIVCDGVTTLFPLPANWDGMSEGEAIQSTAYPIWPVVGPITNEKMAALKAFPVAPFQPVWRVIDGYFEFYPAPSKSEIYKYNYYSNMWIKSASGTPKLAWSADTDASLIDEKLLTTGLEWRWLKSKGLDYAEEFRRFELRLGRIMGQSTSSREVNMSNRRFGINGEDNRVYGVFPGYGSGDFNNDFNQDFAIGP